MYEKNEIFIQVFFHITLEIKAHDFVILSLE